MLPAAVAKKAFLASLAFGVFNLLAIDLVFGPPLFRDEIVAAVALVQTAGDAAATSVPSIDSPPGLPPAAHGNEPRVVARFESSQPGSIVDDELKRLADELRNDGSIDVVLEGHSDPLGDAEYNKSLSLDRANWARDRLVSYGVSASRIETRGLGAAHPLPTIDDSVAVNRRVEARFIPRGTARPELARDVDAGKKPPPRSIADASVEPTSVADASSTSTPVLVTTEAGVLP